MISPNRLTVAFLAFKAAMAVPTTQTAEHHGILLDPSILKALSSVPPSAWTPTARSLELDTEELTSRNVIGTDDRVNWNQTVYPYNAMVKIEWTGRKLCSGVLIGPRHVATARTCAPAFGETGQKFKFMPNFYWGERFPSAGMVNWYMGLVGFGDCVVKDDWAVFILDARLGEQLGYLGAKTFDAATQLNKAQFFHYGWPQDKSVGGFQPMRQEGISVKSLGTGCEPGGSLRTDADVSLGSLGGPLWAVENGDRFVYGVLQDEGRSDYTPFAGGANFVAAVGQTRADYP
ncbi:trypsin-like cysteine/serine peptidase domain-containing protein [Coniochaeta sp. 2T2.1]|nr:trypsin-like cysteine/serine peptidase domain-containing protein [Coniochaeta sp. 2T2.1]